MFSLNRVYTKSLILPFYLNIAYVRLDFSDLVVKNIDEIDSTL